MVEPTLKIGSERWIAQLTDLLKVSGSSAFQQALFEFLNAVVPVDHCVVFTYSDGTGPGHLFTHSKMEADQARQLADDYVKRFHGEDPHYERVKSGAGEEEALIHLDLAEDYDPAYRNHFFDRSQLVDKASTIGAVEQGSVYCNFYRMSGSGRYSPDDWALLQRMLPLVTAVISIHFRLSGANEDADASQNKRDSSLVHSIISGGTNEFAVLTPRERQVCERILLGYTSVGIGLDLDIAPSSVVTYRRRAYTKLGIATQNELFRLCLNVAES